MTKVLALFERSMALMHFQKNLGVLAATVDICHIVLLNSHPLQVWLKACVL